MMKGTTASGHEVIAVNPDRLLLDQVVEVLNGTLDAEGAGPDEGPNVREWVWGGFLDAVTSGS